MLSWRFPVAERAVQLPAGAKEADALAELLSDLFERNGSRVAHYRKLLQLPRMLDLAIIDGILRSVFPDLRCKPDRLGGAWVTQQFRAYRTGKRVEEEVLAWADTPYSYAAIRTILEEAARRQDGQLGQTRRRPLPEEVIVDSSQLRDFWLDGGAWGLQGERHGVDLDGELLSCEQYEQARLQALKQVLSDPAGSTELSPDIAYEIASYHEWLTSPLLANLPRKLLPFLEKLEQVLDQERFLLDVKIELLEDGRRRRVITVQERFEPMQGWLLHTGEDVDAFLGWYEQQQTEGCESHE
jgi:hypothetical protein